MRWPVVALWLVTQLAMVALDQRLEPGIVPFELAGTAEASAAILAAWGPEGQRVALVAQVVDYGYLVGYSLMLRWLFGRWGGGRFADLPLVAAGCDAVENTALLAILLTTPTEAMAGLAAGFASVKFALLVVALAGTAGRGLWRTAARAPAER